MFVEQPCRATLCLVIIIELQLTEFIKIAKGAYRFECNLNVSCCKFAIFKICVPCSPAYIPVFQWLPDFVFVKLKAHVDEHVNRTVYTLLIVLIKTIYRLQVLIYFPFIRQMLNVSNAKPFNNYLRANDFDIMYM